MDGIMPQTARGKRPHQSVEAQLAQAARIIKSANKSIEELDRRAQDLEVEHALALYKSGKATLQDGKEVIAQARRLIG